MSRRGDAARGKKNTDGNFRMMITIKLLSGSEPLRKSNRQALSCVSLDGETASLQAPDTQHEARRGGGATGKKISLMVNYRIMVTINYIWIIIFRLSVGEPVVRRASVSPTNCIPSSEASGVRGGMECVAGKN